MLRAAPELFESVKLIVIDEGHLLGGSDRNVRNELFLEHLRVLSKQKGSRILLLSAVLPNAGQLAMWIGGSEDALAQSQWKPSDERFGLLRWNTKGVELKWRGASRCFNPNFVEFRKVVDPGKQKSRKFPKNKTEAVAATATRLADLGPVLIFAAQARWVPSMARAVLLALQGADTAPHQWPETEWKLFEAVSAESANWLDLLAGDQTSGADEIPTFSNFRLEAPEGVTSLHSRKLDAQDTAFLCSADGRYVVQVGATEDLPFNSVANDPRFVFLRTDDHWRLHCRDPRLRARELTFDDWIF